MLQLGSDARRHPAVLPTRKHVGQRVISDGQLGELIVHQRIAKGPIGWLDAEGQDVPAFSRFGAPPFTESDPHRCNAGDTVHGAHLLEPRSGKVRGSSKCAPWT